MSENQEENLQFEWGKKRNKGGKKRDVQFYESFNFDGEEYTLYYSVYMYKEGEVEPYIGKLIKIWEMPDKSRKVKVLWYFRPCEISNYLGTVMTLENELFLASGEGTGLATVNFLEAIAGKCFVVCTSKEPGNPQPSYEELKTADFIFHRVFDVGSCTILDKMDEKIAGVDVKFLLNKVDSRKPTIDPKPVAEREVGNNVADASKTINLANKATLEECETRVVDLGVINASIKVEESPKMFSDGQNSPCETSLSHKDEMTLAGELDDRPTKRLKCDGSVKGLEIAEFVNKPTKTVKVDGSVKASRNAKLDDKPTEKENAIKRIQTLDHISGGSDSKVIDQQANTLIGKKKYDARQIKLVDARVGKSYSIQNERSKNSKQPCQVTRRPQADKSRWFGGIPWEERLRTAYEQRTVVLLQNLDPSYTSAEVEDIIWHAFNEYCTGKMIQQNTFSSRHNGQALVIFKTKDAADTVVRKLDEGCLLLSNGRPLIGSIATRRLQGNQSIFFGHLTLNRARFQMQREMREAVSTSHCSQPNTVEFEMAMEWCLLQARMDLAWEKLDKQQREEIRKLKDILKSK